MYFLAIGVLELEQFRVLCFFSHRNRGKFAHQGLISPFLVTHNFGKTSISVIQFSFQPISFDQL